ncbi:MULTISPECIES: hypothetical protein [unclassified Paenibacillus]|uniref:hypothetical protein n=1 Tax=unclassified Paenibacillus TaxID=185978 RepID=UPI0003E2AAE2|nr:MULTISPECIES: hypothetical protein [unclassified Paenibacillus]ETT47231.1 hypothetical protein C162_18018 [Paenibacillus sp. FSL R7-269]OMF89265.1 hypothetical protein BK147_25530 [Paenibacillus sp. FSL R7-0337]
MAHPVTKQQVIKLIGKHIVAVKKDGSRVTGKLVRISGNRLILQRISGKKVQTKALIPLVLFDLLAIGTAPYAYGGGYGGGYGGNPYGGGYGYGHGPGPGPVPGPYGGYGPGPGYGIPPIGFF